MATMATYRGVTPVTIIAGATDLPLGTRVSLNASGTCDLQDATKRGDYITIEAVPAGKTGCAFRLSHGEVIALTSEAVLAGDPAYSAAAGKTGKTAASAQYIGKWREAVAANAQGSLLLENLA